MRSLLFPLLVTFGVVGYAQTSVKTVSKPPLDFSVLGKWPSVSNPKISNDGRYAIYTYNANEKQSLIIKSTSVTWEKQIVGASTYNSLITENSQFVLAKVNDSLFIVRLKDGQTEVLPGILSYKTPNEGNGQWLAYQLNDPNKTFVLRNLISGKENRFSSTTDYLFNSNGTVMLLKAETTKDSSSSLQWCDLQTGKAATIWQGQRAGNFCVDATGDHLAFVGNDPDNKSVNAVWYYKAGMDSAMVVADNTSEGIEKGLSISSDQVRFNKDASKIFFYLEPPPLPKPKPGYVSVDVWSWNDAKLQSQQLKETWKTIRYLSVLNISNLPKSNTQNKIIQLEYEGDQISTPIEGRKCDYLLVEHRLGKQYESNWNNASFLSVYLVNTNDGSRKSMKNNIKLWANPYSISPTEKFVINFDSEAKNYFIYNLVTKAYQNITSAIQTSLNLKDGDRPIFKLMPHGIAEWLKDDKAVLIYDRYDIWQVDPLGNRPLINITNGYGKKNQIVFRLLNGTSFINEGTTIPVSSFSLKDKNNGFYNVRLQKSENPQLLFTGPCSINPDNIEHNSLELNSKNAPCYIVSQMTATEPVNFYFTKDFKSLTPLSDVPSPVKTYNWYHTQLMSWKTFDGTESQGILYKPDNFDSTKKYPVILYFYETMSDRLNKFIKPDVCDGAINVPFFVSNGYLVFCPDIHYKIGYPGESAYNSVVSAADYLSQFKWIDSTKMGISGHSFGSYEVNYLVTHTSKFAAAVSASGISDFISGYGSIFGDGYSRQVLFETSQTRIGASLFEKPELYIASSPVFSAKNVTTPVLLMNNKNDGFVPFEQGVEFFTALRRLGKKAWMLQYDSGGHAIDGKEAKDFTIRMKQFFDHYLKDVPPPNWMSKGIPAALKGVDCELDLNR